MASAKFGNYQANFSGKTDRSKIILVALLVVILVLLLALALVLQSRSASAGKTNEVATEVVVDTTTVTLYSPIAEIVVGASLSGVELQEIMWPSDAIPDGAIQDLTELNGKYAKVNLPYGEPILRSQLTTAPVDAVIKINPGMRAVTIDINAKRSVEGWAMPGSHVDVILTYLDQGELTSKLVVENARVLSTGGDASTAEQRLAAGRRKLQVSNTVTLELSPSNALKIETAQQMGTLSLHLRADEDHRSGGVDEFQGKELSNVQDESEGCKKGKMTIAGIDYWLDCSGQLIEVK